MLPVLRLPTSGAQGQQSAKRPVSSNMGYKRGLTQFVARRRAPEMQIYKWSPHTPSSGRGDTGRGMKFILTVLFFVQHTSHGLTHWSSYSILQNKQPRLKRSLTLQMLRHELPPKSCSPYVTSSDRSTHNLISKRMTITTPVGEVGNSELDQAISFPRLHTLKIIHSANPNMIFNLALNTNRSFWFQIFDAAYSLMNQTKANFEQQKKSNHWSQR